ncbi:hypothetical protein C1J03_01635 [Sulfitobacter sp. SK012]|uniref:hypothetical protein n=1 Tax=Sulfitobacter sp. SK012 TaxID=1389005 RepID=UPI000E0ABEED|nr:hypothetical protein [Sulfitobacter sp. SK012]AXI44847.1 hypothetical protein C1J03_01635 [Sulfitobacter sp. SK012]
MMEGAVALVPPRGYCIDRKSLKSNFALLARCDVLGANTSSRNAPFGFITVSFSETETPDVLPTPKQIAKATKVSAPQSIRSSKDYTVFQARSPSPIDGMDSRHWRSVALIGGHVMSAVLYGPKAQRAVTVEGRDMLRSLVQRSIQKTPAQ